MSLETSPILLMFSAQSSAVNPKSLLRPVLIASPSSMKTLSSLPKIQSISCFRATERVDLPEPERPVNQRVAGLNAFISSIQC